MLGAFVCIVYVHVYRWFTWANLVHMCVCMCTRVHACTWAYLGGGADGGAGLSSVDSSGLPTSSGPPLAEQFPVGRRQTGQHLDEPREPAANRTEH